MPRTNVIVVGAGIVGTSAALQLARRGLSVALVDRRGPGEETSYGNTGVIGGAGVYPQAFPSRLSTLLMVALKRATQANYHFAFLRQAVPWLIAYRAASSPKRLEETARLLRPLTAQSIPEHQDLMLESGALRYLRKDGWMSLYRTERAFKELAPELELAAELGVRTVPLDTEGARALEPSLNPVFRHAIHWPDIVTLSNPLAVTRAYAARFAERGGVVLKGDARSLHRTDGRWRVDTAEGPVDADNAVIALGIWAPDVLDPLGIRLPLGIKRGYHRHYRAQGNASLRRPIADTEYGYAMSPMEQGIRVTTGAEFADRDADPTPVQLDRLMPRAKEIFPLGEPAEAEPWMGRRPCFADSRPVIDRAPGQPGLWLNYGHGHWGLSQGAASGRLIAELITGKTTFCDPAPFSAGRFG